MNILKDIDDEVADLLKVTARLLDTKVSEMLTNVEEPSSIIKLIKFISILTSQILKNFPHVIDGASFSILTGYYFRVIFIILLSRDQAPSHKFVLSSITLNSCRLSLSILHVVLAYDQKLNYV